MKKYNITTYITGGGIMFIKRNLECNINANRNYYEIIDKDNKHYYIPIQFTVIEEV